MASNIVKIGAVAVVALFFFAAFSATVSDGESSTNISGIFIEVSDQGLTDPTGHCKWDGGSKTLTIDNLYANGIRISSTVSADNDSPVKLVVKGNCTIEQYDYNDVGFGSGISSARPLTITGSGNLVMKGCGIRGEMYGNNYRNIMGDLVIDGLKSLEITKMPDLSDSGRRTGKGMITWGLGNIAIKNCAKIEFNNCDCAILNNTGNRLNIEEMKGDITIERSKLIFNISNETPDEMVTLILCRNGVIISDMPKGDFVCYDADGNEVTFESGKVVSIEGKSGTEVIINGNTNSALVLFIVMIALIAVAIVGIYVKRKSVKTA